VVGVGLLKCWVNWSRTVRGVSLVVDQQPVGALFADARNGPFRVAVRSGCPGRDLDHVDAFGGEDGIEGGGELGVPVADQVVEGGDPLAEVHQEVAGGLGGSGCGQVSDHAQGWNSSGADFHGQVGPGCDAGVATGPLPGACRCRQFRRAGQAVCAYSWRMPQSRSCRCTLR